MSISSMPEEILDIICNLLEVPALARLAAVSNQCNRLATPRLYHTYVEPPHTTADAICFDPFLRTIIKRPDLARHVRRVLIQYMEVVVQDLETSYPDPELLDPELQVLCAAVAREVCYQHGSGTGYGRETEDVQDFWLRYIDLGSGDARLAILLCLLPNLEALYLQENAMPKSLWKVLKLFRTGIRPARVHPASDALPLSYALPCGTVENINCAFSRLRSVRTDSRRGPKCKYTWLYRTFEIFRMPNIRSLEVGVAIADFDVRVPGSKANEDWPQASSPIERLSFVYSCMNGKGINRVLNSIIALKEFHYICGSLLLYNTHFTIHDLMTALQRHRDVLEVLGVDLEDWHQINWGELPYHNHYFGDRLRSFTKLKSLSCTQQALVGLLNPVADITRPELPQERTISPPDGVPKLDEVLPEQLEELSVYYCDARLVPELERLSCAIKYGRFPELKKVHVEFAEEATGPADIDLDAASVRDLPLTVAFRNPGYRATALKQHIREVSLLYGESMLLDSVDWRGK